MTPSHRPLIFLLVPKFLSKLSAISFLQLLNFGRFKSIFFRGEGVFWITLVRCSLGKVVSGKYINLEKHDEESAGNSSDAEDDSDGDSALEEIEDTPGPCENVIKFFGIILYLALVCMSLQAMLMKLTVVSFAGLTSFNTWKHGEWIVVFGFMNQIAGLCWLEEVELHRLLLFKFGGEDAKWTQSEGHRCDMYFRFIAMKIVTGKIGEKGKTFGGRLASLCTLFTLNADDMQKLLLSKERAERLEEENSHRLEYFTDMFANAGEYRHAMKRYRNLHKTDKEAAREELLGPLEERTQKLKDYMERKTRESPPQLGIAKLAMEQQAYLKASVVSMETKIEADPNRGRRGKKVDDGAGFDSSSDEESASELEHPNQKGESRSLMH